ncbi:MAG: GNAT family N-acetyltransferase [Calditrichaeota bacterium]|nr:GNAT family N-acetyltransferase [Calditrichota bacterium]MCB9367720.1 GNAT family N-acetyltransferase [Calditrichota bacterium]
MQSTASTAAAPKTDSTFEYQIIRSDRQLPKWLDRTALVHFIHSTMTPWQDTQGDISRGLDYAFSKESGKGGFLVLATRREELCGMLLMLNTGMGGYVPENLLLFVSVDPKLRGHGLGTKIIDRALKECKGAVKLHVDFENPAKRLYERIGFTHKYAEMRLAR